jgi:hypothetical protein
MSKVQVIFIPNIIIMPLHVTAKNRTAKLPNLLQAAIRLAQLDLEVSSGKIFELKIWAPHIYDNPFVK